MELVQRPEAALHRALEQSFDVILLDLLMPGINGIEVAQRLKHEPKTANVPIVSLSALGHGDLGEFREQIEALARGTW